MKQDELFKQYIGIDYSGAEAPTSRLKGLQVFRAISGEEPVKIRTHAGEGWNWTRKEVAYLCAKLLSENSQIIICIDHAFSFPMSYMDRYNIGDWDHFLSDFCQHWPTDEDNTYVDFLRENNPRTGMRTEFRLTDKWTSAAKSVFQLDGQGQVGKSTHTGIPWLRFLRQNRAIQARVHFWPFDGFEVPSGISVIAEVYPAIFNSRYARNDRTGHEHDAWSIAMWLKDMDYRGILNRYFNPPLSSDECKQARIEGWILGIN
jgi:hypothetical protein